MVSVHGLHTWMRAHQVIEELVLGAESGLMSSSLFLVLRKCLHVCTKQKKGCITFSLSHERELCIAHVMAMSNAPQAGRVALASHFLEPEDSGDRVGPTIESFFSLAVPAHL